MSHGCRFKKQRLQCDGSGKRRKQGDCKEKEEK